MNQVVILAGGLATRLQPISSETPKSLIPIMGIPFIKLQIENLVKLGVENFHFCLGNQAIKIEEYLTRSDFTGLKISTSRDSKPNQGTARALVDASYYIQDDFFLTYGDSFLPVDIKSLEESWSKYSNPLKISVMEVSGSRHAPNVQLKEHGTFQYGAKATRPTHIDYGFMKVNKTVISFIKNTGIESFETIIGRMSELGTATCAVTFSPLFEIGSFEGIIELENHIGGQNEL
jgi:NDP-sugar pyrophosphorylase family protein